VLRKSGADLISLVAEEKANIIGHILFSPVTLTGHEPVRVAGLGPMAVLPDCQRKGIGTELVNVGLRTCADAGYDAVVVLGHPKYYPRFGFVPSVTYGLRCEYDVPSEVFMVKVLHPQALDGVTGTIRYNPAFNSV